MRYVKLGKTGLEVSAIAFGTWAYGGEWGSFDTTEAKATINRAQDLGITLFDTAQAYGFGVSERLLGEALRERGSRDQVLIATKGGLRPAGDDLVRDAGADWLRRGVEASLAALGTDHIDLYQVHWPDVETPVEETGAVLEDLVREGKILHVGVSNYDVKQMDELAHVGRLETLQPPYHLFRRAIEDEILPYTMANDIGVLVYGPLAHGLLSGRMTSSSTFAPDDWRSHSPDFAGETFRRNLEVVERLRAFAQEREITLPELAVAWTLARPGVDVAIVGARRPSHLDGTASAAEVEFTEQDLEEIDALMAHAAPVHGPSPEGMGQ